MKSKKTTAVSRTKIAISAALAHYNAPDAAIAELGEMFAGLKTNGPEDKKALFAVREARLNIRNIRLVVESTRKELKAEHLAVGQAIDGEARRIKALIEPIESRLAVEEGKVADEIKRRADEAEKIKRVELERRGLLLANAGAYTAVTEIEAMTDEEFEERLEFAEKRQAEAAAVLAETKSKAEKLAIEQKLEADRLAEGAAKLAAEKKKIEALAQEQARKDAAADAERRAKDAEAQAKRDAERAKLEAEKTQAAVKARQEVEKAALKERAAAKKRADKDEADRFLALAPLERIAEELGGIAIKYKDRRLAELADELHTIAKEKK